MTIKIVGFIISGIFVFAFFVTAPAVLIYFVATHEASIDPIISKIGIVACAHPENFTECSEGVMKLARETLEVREERINRWLYGIAGFLGLVTWIFTALAILITLGGVVGIGHFRGLKEEAKDKIKELDRWVKKAKEHHDYIKGHHDEIREMKNNIESEVEDFESKLGEFNKNRGVVSENLEEAQNLTGDIKELIGQSEAIIALFKTAHESKNNILALEETVIGIESEMREILDSLKDSIKKK